MSSIGSVDYEIHRVDGLTRDSSSDSVAIEEPLEILIKYLKDDDWITEPLMVTMRTPGDDKNLVSGLLFSEGIIKDKSAIDSIEVNGNNKGKYDVDNSLMVTLSKGNQLDLKNLQRHFMVNSSCGVCGKGTLNAIEIAYEPKINKEGPTVNIGLISQLPEILKTKQHQFANTGGVHASALLSAEGEVLHLAEDVGRHNAFDKVIGRAYVDEDLSHKVIGACLSGRASYEMVQKAAMVGIEILICIGAPTSLAIDLAVASSITLVGFVSEKGYNIYTCEQRILSTIN